MRSIPSIILCIMLQATAAQAANTPRDLVGEFVAAWNRHDITAFEAIFSEDADFVNVFGSWWQGRDAIARAHRVIATGPFRESTLEPVQIKVNMLNPDVAVILWRWHLSGILRPDNQKVPDRYGVLTQVATRGKRGWTVRTAQNTHAVSDPYQGEKVGQNVERIQELQQRASKFLAASPKPLPHHDVVMSQDATSTTTACHLGEEFFVRVDRAGDVPTMYHLGTWPKDQSEANLRQMIGAIQRDPMQPIAHEAFDITPANELHAVWTAHLAEGQFYLVVKEADGHTHRYRL